VGVLAGYLEHAQMRLFDAVLGVSTEEKVSTRQSIFTAGSDYCPYQGCQWVPVRRALRSLAPKSADVFVDLGSGKGKALLIAGLLPFGRVVGVELDDELAASSQHNIRRARARLRAQEVSTVHANVLEWPVPDDASIVFLYNPFVGETFHAALTRVFESYDRRPRELHVVYSFPWEHDWLVTTGRVVVENVLPILWPALPGWWRTGSVVVIYRVVSGQGADPKPKSPGRWPFGRRRRAMRRWQGTNQHRFSMSQPGHQPVYSR
jgi:hypothetical protein